MQVPSADKQIPADVIYLDIHLYERFQDLHFDKNNFPDPKGLIEKLESQGFKVVVILNPGIATKKGYGTYDRGIERDAFVKYPDGAIWASVWPGNSHFTDFTSEDARAWWQEEMKFYTELGIEGILEYYERTCLLGPRHARLNRV